MLASIITFIKSKLSLWLSYLIAYFTLSIIFNELHATPMAYLIMMHDPEVIITSHSIDNDY